MLPEMSPTLGLSCASDIFSVSVISSDGNLYSAAAKGGAANRSLSRFDFEVFANEEREFQRLRGVETRIAMRVITVGKAFVCDRLRTTGALGHILAGQLDMYATGMGALGLVDGYEALYRAGSVERPRLVARFAP